MEAKRWLRLALALSDRQHNHLARRRSEVGNRLAAFGDWLTDSGYSGGMEQAKALPER